ncbi:MAG: CDP-glucose 4,6-dehydratase [Phycisphaerales bacterium]|nr:CDP-glucose 4,6-dehydratase [Phycisphaerales bacterium]
MNIFQNRSVFLTGHTGFKGSWLTLWLHKLGAQIHGYSLPPESPSLFKEANIAELLTSHTLADIRDTTALNRVLQKAQPEIIFHLAAQSLVRRSYLDPRQTFETNILGTVNLLEAARQLDSLRVIQIITSDKCYAFANEPRHETAPLGGNDPYSASKAAVELITNAYRSSFFNQVSIATVRSGNIIGGGDWAQDRLIPDCIRSLQKNEPILIRNPTAIRPWQHILDPLAGYLQLVAHQWTNPHNFSTAFNFGPLPASHITVQALVNRIIAAWNGEANVPDCYHGVPDTRIATQFHESPTLRLDITKAQSLLQWQPRHTIDQAITKTIQWYKARLTPTFNARDLCLTQIANYQH